MDSFEVNKLIGGLLGTVFVVFSVGLVSDALFASPSPEKPGFVIEATEEPAEGAAAGPAEPTPIAQLLPTASAEKGAAIFKKCQACHSGEKGGPNKVGPDLWDIVDRPIAEHEGFSYSAGMKDFSKGGSEKWTYDHLYHFLLSPKNYVKGTAMGFAGLKKDDERADVIAYLRTLSDNPKPLPEAAAPAAEGEKPADAGKPAEGEKPAAPADAEKPAAPAEAEKPAAPAKADKPATPAEAAPAEAAPAAPAEGEKPAEQPAQ